MESVVLLVVTDAVWTMLTSSPASEMPPQMTGAVKTYLLVEWLPLPWLCVTLALSGYLGLNSVCLLDDLHSCFL